MPISRFASLLYILSFLLSCNSVYTPKRRGFFRIDFPPHQYQTFDQPGYPYTFEYPIYANVLKDSTYFDSVAENPWWINIDFPSFGARIYISYKDIGKPTDQRSVGRRPDEKGMTPKGKFDGSPKAAYASFEKLRDDAFKMTFKHTYKASSIEDSVFTTPNGVGGDFFRVGGNAATANQFFVTDTTRHFLDRKSVV